MHPSIYLLPLYCPIKSIDLIIPIKFGDTVLLSSTQNHLKEWMKEKVKVTQSCPTLCEPMDYTDHGTLQTRLLEWVAFPFSSRSSWLRNQIGVSCIAGGFLTNWTILILLKSSHERTSETKNWKKKPKFSVKFPPKFILYLKST